MNIYGKTIRQKKFHDMICIQFSSYLNQVLPTSDCHIFPFLSILKCLFFPSESQENSEIMLSFRKSLPNIYFAQNNWFISWKYTELMEHFRLELLLFFFVYIPRF